MFWVFWGSLAGVIALFVALSAKGQLKILTERVQALDHHVRDLQRQLEQVGKALGTGESRSAPAVEAAASIAEPAPTPLSPSAARITFARPEQAPNDATGEQPAATLAQAPQPASSAIRSPAPASAAFEERLGGRYTVWVGGVAVALGALLLVRYSIEQGLFGPGMRIGLASLLSAALVAGGEWLRRSERKISIEGIPQANIPAVLTAAGTIAAFGTVYAAHALYGFVGASVSFTLLAAVALATLAAALVHGPALAGLGLVGSFATPMLVTSHNPSPWPVVVFLLVVAVAAHELARRKRWQWLTAASAAGTILWSLLFSGAVATGTMHISAAMLHTLVQLLVAVSMLVWRPGAVAHDGAKQDGVALTIFAGFAGAAALVFASNNGISWAAMLFALSVVVALSVAGLRTATASSMPVSGATAIAVLAAWPGGRLMTHLALTYPVAPSLFIVMAVAMTASIFALATLRLWLASALMPMTSAIYASAATVVPLVAVALVDARIVQFDPSLPFAFAGLVLAIVFATVTSLFEARVTDARASAAELMIGIFATAAAAAVALAATLGLQHGTLNAALAMTALAASYIADRRRIPLLRQGVAAIGLLVLAHVFVAPHVGMFDVGTTPVFNWLLVGYGVPVFAFWAAARILSRNGQDMAQRISDALGIVFAALLAFVEIRHLLNHGNVLAATTDHVEQGLMATVGFLFSYALMRSGVSTANPVFRFASYAFGVVSAAVALISLGILHNPAFANERVYGYGPLSSLMLGYLLPAFAAAIVARAARSRWPQPAVFVAAGTALALLFAFATLEVRHAFHGANLWIGQYTSQMEFWTYSAIWLMLGIALLAYGIIRDAVDVRLASAVLVVLTVLKVFVLDLAGLSGIWRPLSFISLGFVLLGIGLIYQRFLSLPGTQRRAS